MVGGCIEAVLRDVASRICSILLAASLCNCRQAFSFWKLFRPVFKLGTSSTFPQTIKITLIHALSLKKYFPFIITVWFGLVLWHISTFVGYLMPNRVYAYIYIYMIWFGWVLGHINRCTLFNTKSTFYIYVYIKYI